MKHLINAIQDFRKWQISKYPSIVPDKIDGEWETDYTDWNRINTIFSKFLEEHTASDATEELLNEMIYIIARDNECEWLINEVTKHPDWFDVLCRYCIHTNENEAKWQFAAHISNCSCSRETKDLILEFVTDKNEYVSRRALLALPAIRPDKVEYYAHQFWYRDSYDIKMQEYQKMAVLTVLNEIKSPLLSYYLQSAKKDGRKYLMQCAEKIEKT